MRIDPITLAVVRGALEQAAQEMDSSLARGAFSTSIAEGYDSANGIYEGETGEMIAQGPDSLPMFVGNMQFTVQEFLRRIDIKSVSPGDVFIVNDVYCAGTHLMDVKLIKPFFYQGRLLAWLANTGHWVDVGSSVPGGYDTQATEVFQEGLRLPPVKIYGRDGIVKDVLSIILINIRTPREGYGDMMSQINALHVGESRLTELFTRYGPELMLGCIEEFKARAEQQMRSYIQEIPDGEYSFNDQLDNDGIEDRPLAIKLKMRVKGSDLLLDFSGSSGQSRGPLNIAEAGTKSSCFVAIKHLFADVPINAGCFKPISFVIPPGTFISAQHPQATAAYNEVAMRIIDTVFGAFAQALPEKSYGASYSTSNNLTIGGTGSSKGNFVVFMFHAGGAGGTYSGDGLTAAPPPPSTGKTQPVEIYEHRFPILFHEFALREGSAGAGKHRGGFGTIYEFELLEGQAAASFVGDRAKTPPFGILGGKSAKTNRFVFRLDGKEYVPPLLTKGHRIQLKSGDRIRLETPGGGGYGEPWDRDPEQVRKDVKSGYITTEAAAEEYGVVVVREENNLKLDERHTAKLRARRNEVSPK